MRKIILLCMGIGLWGVVCSQSPKYSNEELLQLFKEKGSFKAFEELNTFYVDYKACYYDTLLKPYFMELLDPVKYAQYQYDKSHEELRNNTEFLNSRIISKFKKQGKEELLDSIFNDSTLLKIYRDSAFFEYTKNDAEKIRNAGKINPSTIHFHRLLLYPESYTIIKKYWERKPEERKAALYALLRFEDPEAQEYVLEQKGKVLKSWESIREVDQIAAYLLGSDNFFGIRHAVDLLDIDAQITLISGDPLIEYRCDLLQSFADIIYTAYDIPIADMRKNIYPCDQLMENIEEIKRLATSEELKERIEKKNAYRKKNIEYIYTEKDK